MPLLRRRPASTWGPQVSTVARPQHKRAQFELPPLSYNFSFLGTDIRTSYVSRFSEAPRLAASIPGQFCVRYVCQCVRRDLLCSVAYNYLRSQHKAVQLAAEERRSAQEIFQQKVKTEESALCRNKLHDETTFNSKERECNQLCRTLTGRPHSFTVYSLKTLK
jgi:hypothetical protein